jgi:hypothetical protein
MRTAKGIGRFRHALSKPDISLELYQCQADFINEAIATDGRHRIRYRFDRIDLSIITDSMYKDSKIVTSFAPFLRSPKEKHPRNNSVALYEYLERVAPVHTDSNHCSRAEDHRRNF